jgi:TonB family protein
LGMVPLRVVAAIDTDQRVKALMRVLAYDRRLDARQDGGKIFIGVLFRAGAKSSVAEKDKILAALGGLSGLTIKGFGISYAAFPYPDAGSLNSSLGGRRAAAVYVCDGLGDAVGDIAEAAAQSKIATMSGSEPFTQSGLAFAVVDKGGKSQIVVNLSASKAQGLDLDASLLGIATVLRPGSGQGAASAASGPVFQSTEVAAKRKISGEEPQFPARARIQGWEATLTARVYIAPQGSVERIEFVQTDKNFEDAVKKAVKAWKYKPYVVDGTAVGTYTVMKFVFKLH